MAYDEFKLSTFKELQALLPMGEKALRRVVASLGYRPAPGTRNLFFREADVRAIVAAIAARRVNANEPVEMLTPVEKARRTRRIAQQVRTEMGSRMGQSLTKPPGVTKPKP